jgi:hypothetical protein
MHQHDVVQREPIVHGSHTTDGLWRHHSPKGRVLASKAQIANVGKLGLNFLSGK